MESKTEYQTSSITRTYLLSKTIKLKGKTLKGVTLILGQLYLQLHHRTLCKNQRVKRKNYKITEFCVLFR